MKISVVTTVHYNDDNRIFKKEINSLLKLGEEIYYFAPDNMSDINTSIKYFNVNSFGKNKLIKIFRLFTKLKKLKVDILHFHDPELMILGILIKLFSNIKVIYDVHEDYPNDILNKAYLNKISKFSYFIIVSFLEKLSNLIFDGIIVADERILEKFNNKKAIILYNYPILNQYKLKRYVSFEERKYDIVYAGMLTEIMVDNIINAINQLIRKDLHLKVLLVSPFNFKGGINLVKEKLVSKKLIDYVELRERVSPDKIPNILFSAKIGIIPLENTAKMRRNIPTKLFEYMAAGNIIVSNDLPPIRKYDQNEEFVLFCNTSLSSDFANTIVKAIKTSNHKKVMEIMNKNVFQFYDWSVEEIKLLNFYKRYYYVDK